MSALIEYRNVEILRKELLVLKNVNFSLQEGEFVYLIGRVGSGKSSLMKTMYAEVPIELGEARIFDYDLMNLRRRDVPMLRRKIGVVFQDFQLLSDRSVYDNLPFVLKATGWKDKNDINERIEEVLKEVGMSNKSYKMPHELSGGEQQRIAIARGLLRPGTVLLLDEISSALDEETERQLFGRLLASRPDTTMLLITHRPNVASICDECLTIPV